MDELTGKATEGMMVLAACLGEAFAERKIDDFRLSRVSLGDSRLELRLGEHRTHVVFTEWSIGQRGVARVLVDDAMLRLHSAAYGSKEVIEE